MPYGNHAPCHPPSRHAVDDGGAVVLFRGKRRNVKGIGWCWTDHRDVVPAGDQDEAPRMKPRLGDQLGIEARDGDFGTDQVVHVVVGRLGGRKTGIDGFAAAPEDQKPPQRIDVVEERVHDGTLEAHKLVVEKTFRQASCIDLDGRRNGSLEEHIGGLGDGIAGMAPKPGFGRSSDVDVIAFRQAVFRRCLRHFDHDGAGGVLHGAPIHVLRVRLNDGCRYVKRHSASALAQGFRECGDGRNRVLVSGFGENRKQRRKKNDTCRQ